MHICVSLDDTIRNTQEAWNDFKINNNILSWTLKSNLDSKWLDYKSLIQPIKEAEYFINKWYDEKNYISIIAADDKYNQKWLKDHFIPYDEIIEFPKSDVDILIDCNIHTCIIVLNFSKIKKSYYLNISNKFIENELFNLSCNIDLNKFKIIKNWNECNL